MADALKTFFSPALVRRLAAELARVHPVFPTQAFVKQASEGLGALELPARGRHIAAALARALPPDYPKALEVLLASLGNGHAEDELLGVGMAPFYYLPHTIFVAEHGLGHFDLSMRAQVELTKRFTAEFSMRPFIAHDPERALTFLRRWARDRDAHVRRLASECTRLRLPWGTRVPWLDAHPERVLELLELLRDDASAMVRRSVANNLNDLGKVRPDLLTSVCAAWLDGATAERRALVEHALRSAIKRGEPAALRLLGYGKKVAVTVENVAFAPPRVKIGGRVVMTFELVSAARVAADVLIDVAVHFVKARGHAAPKVFKLTRAVLPARGRLPFRTSFSLAVHTTRKPHPGEHVVDVVVNGQARRAGSFLVAR